MAFRKQAKLEKRKFIMKKFLLILAIGLLCPSAFSASSYTLNFQTGAELAPRLITINVAEPLTISCNTYGNITIQWGSIKECYSLKTTLFYCGNFPNLEQAVMTTGSHGFEFSQLGNSWEMRYADSNGVDISWPRLLCQ